MFTSFIDNFKDAEGNVYGVPMEAFIKINLYRKDLFENPEIQAAFMEQYGYELAPATTHDQYRDNAEFFTAYGQENDLDLWGTTVQGHTGHSSSFYELVETILPTFGIYNWGVNLETWKACVENGGELNSDAAKEGFAFWVDMLDYAPPEATSSTWDEVAASFAAGPRGPGLGLRRKCGLDRYRSGPLDCSGQCRRGHSAVGGGRHGRCRGRRGLRRLL
jgi:multiple sugar transport system substrate-binding protein